MVLSRRQRENTLVNKFWSLCIPFLLYEEYKKFQNETEDKLMSILNYISGEHYKKVEEEIGAKESYIYMQYMDMLKI